MKIAIILGTRPEIIKMSPIVRACEKQGVGFFILHTGQHWSPEMDRKIFTDLELPKPKYNLGVGGEPYRKQVGFMTKEISIILAKEKPDVVLVQGDTISVLAGALAANKLGIKIGHHEAGLRSHDLNMVEETNRVIVDHISDFLFVPTPDALKNLHQEGRDPEKIHLTGNTIVDAILQNIKIAEKKTDILKKLKLKKKNYFLATAHRAENVDKKERLVGIIGGLAAIGEEFSAPVIFPMHPRTKARIEEFQIKIPVSVRITKPLGFLEFLMLQKNAKIVLTDSGGLQEESFILRVPCVTLRDSTERPETVEYGANIVAGTETEKILGAVKKMYGKNLNLKKWDNPFGDGTAGEKIVKLLVELTK